jgi:hypothetical protein
VARDDDAVFVQNGDRRVPVEPEGAGELDVRVGERRPCPAVLGQERLRLVPVVGDVQADELILGMALGELRVGDRLAVADGSPRGPHVQIDRPPAEVRQGDVPAVERLPLELERVCCSRLRGRPGRRTVAVRPASAAGEDEH